MNVRFTFFLAASIALLALIFPGCSATRYLSENESLVKRSTLEGVDNDLKEQAFLYVQQSVRKNSRLNLGLYNLFNTKNGKYRTDRIKDIGEAPHILDSTMVEISRNEIEKFLRKKGYFKAKVKSDVKIKDKKAYVTFTANQGQLYRVRNYSYSIADSAVKSLYETNRPYFTKVSNGMRFDEDSILYESKQVFDLLQANGYYEYVQSYMHGSLDTNLKGLVDVKMVIDNPPNRSNHQVFLVHDTWFTIANSNGNFRSRLPVDSFYLDSQYRFKDYSRRFRFKPISRYVFINKYDRFNSTRRDLTYNRLYELNAFRNITIEYVKRKDDSTMLDAKIDVVPLKRMSSKLEGEYTFNSGRNGFNIGNTYTNRNLFGGAEQLDVKLRYGILFNTGITGSLKDRVDNRDFQIGLNLTIPKLLFPIALPSLGRYGIPRTIFSSSLQLFDQANVFSNRLFINSITYNWAESHYKVHNLTPVNIEYRDGRFNPSFMNTLNDRGLKAFVDINGRQTINLGSQYSYTYNNLRLNSYENFVYLRNFIDVGGNSLALFANALSLPKNGSQRTLWGLRYLQYVKGEVDLRFYRYLGKERQFILRLYPGFAYPYGNINELPFEKKFYAGGSTGIRAWQARTLGPGNYNRSIIDSAVRGKNNNLDQLGEIKFEGNLEYRFKIMESLFGAKVKGATFADFGNVWALNKLKTTDSLEYDYVQLKLNKLFSQIAIGTGVGLRFDLDYFVFRLDMGIKVKDPQFEKGDQWVIKNLFDNKEFKKAYERTNSPDKYSFIQYNFGIQMPF